MTTTEYVACDCQTKGHKAGAMGKCDAWTCLCGNTPDGHGFYPCDSEGIEVEPTAELWTSGLYLCAKCDRVIEAKTGKVLFKKRNL
jgi:hypothetical protein